jgi:hypothetical protein
MFFFNNGFEFNAQSYRNAKYCISMVGIVACYIRLLRKIVSSKILTFPYIF